MGALLRDRKFNGNGIVVGGLNTVVYSPPGTNLTGNIDPINTTRRLERQASRSGRVRRQLHRVVKPGTVQRYSGIALAGIHVEIPSHDHQRRRSVYFGVIQSLSHLRQTESIVSLTLEVQVVGHNSLVVDVGLGD